MSFALDRWTGTLFTPVANPGPTTTTGAPAPTSYQLCRCADALTGVEAVYQLRADYDWDTTVVSLFDSGGKKLVATAGKEGVARCQPRGRQTRVCCL